MTDKQTADTAQGRAAPSETAGVMTLRPIDNLDRQQIIRLVCGGEGQCDTPCNDCPGGLVRNVVAVLIAIEKAGCVVMRKD